MAWKPVSAHTNFIAIHAALVPTKPQGEILYFGGQSTGVEVPGGVLRVGIHDGENPATPDPEIQSTVSPTCNLFCCGHCRLADGRLLLAGGTLGWPSHVGVHGEHYDGERCAWIYTPGAEAFAQAQPMQFQPGSSSQGGGRWYPSLLTLSTGEAFIAGGHPDVTDAYAPPPDITLRHNNNTPEIYSATTNSWRYVQDGNGNIPTTHQNVVLDQNNQPAFTENYPRLHLTREGHIFFATTNRGKNRILDPYAGEFTPFAVDVPSEGIYQVGSAGSSVALPLLPGDAYELHVLVTGAEKARRIDVHGPNPQWYEAGSPNHTREDAWNATPPLRHHNLAVLLPNGKVFVCGGCETDGENDVRDASSILAAELYDPGIDWSLGIYDGTKGEWEKLEDATVKRHYHSTALLLPDGSVWTGGSNRHGTAGETAVEIYVPDYGSGRPNIDNAPHELGYGHAFIIETAESEDIQRVALMRCGAVTHAYDSDQLYVGLNFEKAEPGFLEAYSPPHGGIAPPGDYMLFVIDGQGRPCNLAWFLRLTAERCYFQVNLSTFSEVDVLSFGHAEARFEDAFRVVLEGFLPDQTPVPQIQLVGPNGPIPDEQVVLQLMAIKPEGDPQSTLIAQRIAFTYDVIFKSTDIFAGVPDTGQPISVRAEHGALVCTAPLMLTTTPNPFMRDIGDQGNPPWLSVDLRAFRVAEGEDPFAGVTQQGGASAPFDYLASLLDAFNANGASDSHPFMAISEDQEANRLAVFDEDAQGRKIYNYAIAKVRYRAPVGTDAPDVRLIFRLFTTITPGLSYVPEIYHLSGTPGPDVRPLLGLAAGEIVTIPFFAEERRPKLIDQPDMRNVETLVGQGNMEVVHYFGCYLDINRPNEPRFPLNPSDHTGESGGPLLPILDLMRGLHQCLVAEIHFPPDSIPPGATPGSHDNLSQRNILFDKTDNPGGFASHLVHHTFQLKPSANQLPQQPAPPLAVATGVAGRLLPDELMFEWGNLPADSYATLYLPDVNADEILKSVGLRAGPANLARVDDHTLRCRITPITYIPIPGPRQSRIPGLLTIQLPPNLSQGQKYRIIGRQASGGVFQRIIGSFEFEVSVATAAVIGPEVERRLSVLKYIAQSIPAGNRWYPIFARWLGQLGERVRAFGGDPDIIEASPSGSGRRPRPMPRPTPPGAEPGLDQDEGLVCHILYDCFGRFEGFVLDVCGAHRPFRSREPAIEKLVRAACRERAGLIVYTRGEQPDRPVRIIWSC